MPVRAPRHRRRAGARRRWSAVVGGLVVLGCMPGPAGAGPTPVRPPVRPTVVAPASVPSEAGPVAYRAPVTPLRVLRPFAPPATRYGPGHLGVDLAAAGVVRSAGPGVVTLAGPVAGRGVVVVLHPDGVRTEYEPLRPAVRRGQHVAAGDVLGTVSGTHPGCPGPCLHWGARRGADYVDPLGLLRPLGPVRLLPWDG